MRVCLCRKSHQIGVQVEVPVARRARGYKRAIIAIGDKILRTTFFTLKRREHCWNCAADYEALSVQRNAPRWIKALTKLKASIKLSFIKPASP